MPHGPNQNQLRMLERITDFLKGKPDVSRSPQWPAVRKAHLAKHPKCEVCQSESSLNVHHIFPVHLSPEGELAPNNLITLCEGGVVNCHLLYGHLRNWKSFNLIVVEDAALWKEKINNRPK